MPARAGLSGMLSPPDGSPSAHFGKQADGSQRAVELAGTLTGFLKNRCLWTPQSSGSLQRARSGRPSSSQEITVFLSPSRQGRGGERQGWAEPPAHGRSFGARGRGQNCNHPRGEVTFTQPLTGCCLPGAAQLPLPEHLIGREGPAPQGDQVTPCPWTSASLVAAHGDASPAGRV